MLRELLSSSAELSEVATFLSALEPDERVREVRSLTADFQRKLWRLCESAPPYSVDELLATDGAAVFAGRNSLRTFSLFEKRLTREGSKVIGWNAHPLRWLIGRGYFTAVDTPDGLVFDYTGFSANSFGAARLVYHGLRDACRRVAHDVLVGSAARHGQLLDAYFVIARVR